MKSASIPEVFGNKRHLLSAATTVENPLDHRKDFHVEVCSSCHPFYTGKQKIVDTAGASRNSRPALQGQVRAKVIPDKSWTPPVSRFPEPFPEKGSQAAFFVPRIDA